MTAHSVWAIVPAAGTGSRLPGDVPKQYRSLAGRSVLDHSLQRLLDHPAVVGVMLALAADDEHWTDSAFYQHPKVQLCQGGAERADSVLAALQALARCALPIAPDQAVLVHDAARALLPATCLQRLLQDPPSEHGALLALPAQDSLKFSRAGDCVEHSLERSHVWLAQTPQYFEYARLFQALQTALAQDLQITDEASCMERAGYQPRLILGDARNFKITTPADLALAQALLAQPEPR